MKIRPYDASDKVACLAMFGELVGTWFAPHETELFDRFLCDKTTITPYFVVTIDDTIVACGGYAQDDNEITLTWGMVAQSSHRSGVGTQLVQHRLDCIDRELGQQPIRIDTSQLTQAFYERFGFRAIESTPDGFGPGIDKVVMIRPPTQAQTAP